MKKFYKFALTALAALGTLAMNSCDNYDDSGIRKDMDDLKGRVTTLEQATTSIGQMLDQGALIKTVTPLPDEAGYRIEFVDGASRADLSSIEIMHGKDGQDGQDGNHGNHGVTPMFEVRRNNDGTISLWVDYGDGWTNTGTDITGPRGTGGSNGNDGMMPYIGEDGNWYIGTTDTGIPATGATGTTPHIGENGNWYIGTTDTGVKAAGANAFIKLSVADNEGVLTLWNTTDATKAELTPSVDNGWTPLLPIGSIGPVAAIVDNGDGTLTITLNDANPNALSGPKPATTFTFERASSAVRFEILNWGTTTIKEDETGLLKFIVNPSTAWIPTGAGAAIVKWALHDVGTAKTRAPGYVKPSTAFSIESVSAASADPSRQGEYVAVLRGATEIADVIHLTTLVLNTGSDTAPVLVSSAPFALAPTATAPPPPPAKAVASIAVTALPTKMVYNVGEAFDPAGMVVTATYTDQTTTTITPTNFTYDFSTAGTGKIVTITYEGQSAQISGITVNAVTFGKEANVLGRGYDVTGSYAYSPEIKSAVLDFGSLRTAGWVIQDTDMRESEFVTTSGSTIEEYSNSLAVSAGWTGGVDLPVGVAFQSELTSRFDMDKLRSDAYSFSIASSRIRSDAWYVQNRTNPTRLREHLSAAFLEDLQNETPETILSNYGTHVMLGGVWGARLDFHYTAKKRIDGYAVGAGVSFASKASVDLGILTASGGPSTSVETAFAQMYQTTTVDYKTRAVGGLSQYAQDVQNSQDYNAWINSIEGNEVWCDYYPNSLVPLYDLVEDATKRQALKNAYDNYVAGKKIIVTTALASGVKEMYFEFRGKKNETVIVEGGDANIDSKQDKDTFAQVTVDLLKSGSNVSAMFHYVVQEGGGNSSKLTLTETVTIPINLSEFRITGKTTWTSDILNHPWKQEENQWWEMQLDCPFLPNNKWSIKIDGPGDDENNIGIKGTFHIPYEYMQ